MPNDLTLSDLPEKRITPVLSPHLAALLEAEPSAAPNAIADIASYMALREEAKAVLPVLKAAALQKAGRRGVSEVIGRRFALFPQPDRSDGEWAAWWEDYYETLGDVPWAALEAAMAAYVADPSSEFMPKPGKLLELARTTPNKAVRAYDRASKAVAYHQQAAALPPPSERRLPTDEERAQVMNMLGHYKRTMAQRDLDAPKPPPLPSIAGKADERGITPAMRDLLARQRGNQ